MKNYNVLTLIVAAMLAGAVPLAAQNCVMGFNISFYEDGSMSSDFSTVYGYSNFIDNSQTCRCTHSYYQIYVALYDPNGTYLSSLQQYGESSSTSAPTFGNLGIYTVSAGFQFICSCVGRVGAGGINDIFYPYTIDDPTTLYSLMSTMNGQSPGTIEGWFSGVLYNPGVAITVDNINIMGLGTLSSGGGDSIDPTYESYLNQIGFSLQSTAAPTSIPWPSVWGPIITAASHANPAAIGVLVLGSVLFMTGDKPAGWDGSNSEHCLQGLYTDIGTCGQRFPYGTGQGVKYLACKNSAYLRYGACMRDEPLPPLMPQY